MDIRAQYVSWKTKLAEDEKKQAIYNNDLNRLAKSGKELVDRITNDEKLSRVAEKFGLSLNIDWEEFKTDEKYKQSVISHIISIKDKIYVYLGESLNEV